MTLESTIIPRKVRVFSATYANLPTTGLVEEDLGYATDRLVLYRWSGAAWVAITIYVSSGAAASIPTAANLPNGSIYHETDTDLVKMVEAGAWATIAQPASNLTVAETEVYSANSPAAWTDLDLSAVVGANVALVILKVMITGSKSAAFRKNGDTDEHYAATTTEARGAACAECDAAFFIIFVVVTDAAGIVEWKSEAAAVATVDIIGFIA